MRGKKLKTESRAAARARVLKALAKPRMTKSARLAEQKLDPARVAVRPSVTLPAIVDRIIRSIRRSQPERAQIALDGAHRPHRNLRIENELLDENGDDVRLKKGAHVDVTVTSEPDR